MNIKNLKLKLSEAIDNVADDGFEAFDGFGGSQSERQTLIDDAHTISKLDDMVKLAKANKPLNKSDISWAKRVSF